MAAALERGMSLSDFESMEIGAIVDFITTYNNLRHVDDDSDDENPGQNKKDKAIIRRATQEDWDAFSS